MKTAKRKRAQLVVGEVVRVNHVDLTNDVGGCAWLTGAFDVEVIRVWHDYENGWNAEGRLIKEADIEQARAKGTTGHSPSDYREYEGKNPGMVRAVERARREFNPAKVYISEWHVMDARGRAVLA